MGTARHPKRRDSCCPRKAPCRPTASAPRTSPARPQRWGSTKAPAASSAGWGRTSAPRSLLGGRRLRLLRRQRRLSRTVRGARPTYARGSGLCQHRDAAVSWQRATRSDLWDVVAQSESGADLSGDHEVPAAMSGCIAPAHHPQPAARCMRAPAWRYAAALRG